MTYSAYIQKQKMLIRRRHEGETFLIQKGETLNINQTETLLMRNDEAMPLNQSEKLLNDLDSLKGLNTGERLKFCRAR